MDKLKSNDLNFLFLINKTTFLLEYIDIYYQKEILNDINRFIKNLNDTFSKQYFENESKKKEKTFEILNKYFCNLINEQILYLINIYHKDEKNNIIILCEKKANKIILEKKKELEQNIHDNISKKVDTSVKVIKNEFYKNIEFDKNINGTNNINNFDTIIQEKIELFFLHFENKLKKDIDTMLKKDISVIFNENVYPDIDKKIKDNNTILNDKIEDFFKIFFKEENVYHKITKKIKSDLNEVYEYLEENKKLLKEFEKIKSIITENEKNIHIIEKNIVKKVNINFEDKIKILTTIFNDTINNIAKILNNKIDEIEVNKNSSKKNKYLFDNADENYIIEKIQNQIQNQLQNEVQTQIQNYNQNHNQNHDQNHNQNHLKYNIDKNKFNIKFNKENNDIELYYNNELITSTKLNIKGLIGPRGMQGIQGEKGDLTIVRNITIDNDKKLKFTLQNGTNIYEIKTNHTIPKGDQGIQGIRGIKGEPGEINVNIKWDQENVMKINKEQSDSLIFLKSLCIGENSHCLKNNSLSIGGSICYKDNSISIGNNSKTFDSNSIAFFGSTLGKNSIAYFSENIEENCIGFGSKTNDKYNIEKIHFKSKEISFECDELILNDNILKNKYLKILEDRVTNLENEILLLNK